MQTGFDAFLGRLEGLIGEEGPYAWASRLGIKKGPLQTIYHRKSIPGSEWLIDVCEKTGWSLDYLLRGIAGQASPAQLEGAKSDFEERFALIPLYDARISSGHGAWNEGSKVLTMLAFTRYSLQKKGLDPACLAAVQNDGDSNLPTLADGDTVMMDLRVTRVEGDAFYVVRLEDRLYAKRLQVSFDGSLNIISENKAYKDIVVPRERVHEVHVVGRACWAGRWLL